MQAERYNGFSKGKKPEEKLRTKKWLELNESSKMQDDPSKIVVGKHTESEQALREFSEIMDPGKIKDKEPTEKKKERAIDRYFPSENMSDKEWEAAAKMLVQDYNKKNRFEPDEVMTLDEILVDNGIETQEENRRGGSSEARRTAGMDLLESMINQ